MSKNKAAQITALTSLMDRAREIHGQDTPEAAVPSGAPSGIPPARTFSFRLSGAGSLKIDAIILNTQKTTRERITATDVLNHALASLPETAFTLEQIKAIRAHDGRRRKVQ
jgi:hypothetical protein